MPQGVREGFLEEVTTKLRPKVYIQVEVSQILAQVVLVLGRVS